jgi:hypothetical protein
MVRPSLSYLLPDLASGKPSVKMLVMFNTVGLQAVWYETIAQLFHAEQDDRVIMYDELVD